MKSRKKWTEDENNLIRELYPQLGPKELALKMQIDQKTLVNRACYLGVKILFEWTPERLEILKRYPIDGAKKLSEELGVSVWAVTAKARRLGLDSTRKKPPKDFTWSDDKISLLKEKYDKEEPKILAKQLGIHIATLWKQAAKLGLETNAGHRAWGKLREETNNSYDIHYFDTWSPNMAYVLGFIFADGSVNKKLRDVRILINSKDVSVLEFIKKELQSSGEIRTSWYKDKRGWNNKPYSYLIFSSTYIAKRLGNLGCHPRKTYTNDPFPNVPDDMMPHFVRGYLDGDGTTSISSKDVCTVGFVGSPKFIEGLRDAVVRLVGMRKTSIYTRKGIKADWSSMHWEALDDIKKFYNYVYPEGHGFCLERKKRNLVEWLSKPRFGRGHFFGNKWTGPTEGVKLPPSLLTL